MAYRIQKWGNSNGVRIPKVYLEALNIKAGDAIEIVREDNKIIITKAQKPKETLKFIVTKALRKPETLKSRIKKYKGPEKVEDFTWDEARGKELW